MYQAGTELSRFIAPDIRRHIKVVDNSELDDSFITVEVRTWNVLYAINGLTPEPDKGELKRVALDMLWAWEGAVWGGPVPREE